MSRTLEERNAALLAAVKAAEREIDLLQRAVALYEANDLRRASAPGGNVEIVRAVDRAFERFGEEPDYGEIASGGPRGETDARASTPNAEANDAD